MREGSLVELGDGLVILTFPKETIYKNKNYRSLDLIILDCKGPNEKISPK